MAHSSRSSRDHLSVRAARQKCHLLYDGVFTGHRSCGIALAETFGLATPAYQVLRRGGLTGEGPCGAIMAGRMVLGELLGDPAPEGAPTEPLKEGISVFDARYPGRINRGNAAGQSTICNTLTGQFVTFRGQPRHTFCTSLATEIATLVAEILVELNHPVSISPIKGLPSFDPKNPADI
jgi:hypothetical protein